MDQSEATDPLVSQRRLRGEPESVEAKKALSRLPDSMRSKLSAFSNTAGGVVLLEIDEARDFAVVDLKSPTAVQNDLAKMAREDLTPPLRREDATARRS